MIKKITTLSFLVVISLFIYNSWLSFNLFSYGDYVYYTNDSLLSLFPITVWKSYFDLAGFDFLLWRIPQSALYYLGARVNLEFNVIDRFIVLWPWILLPIFSIYLFLNSFIKSERAKLIGSLVFLFNTYFLSISTQGHLLISLASCVSVITFLAFLKFIKNHKYSLALLVAFLLSIVSVIDLRILYLTVFIFFLYLIFAFLTKTISLSVLRKLIKPGILLVFIYLLINSFWIIPFAVDDGSSLGNILKRPLFGNEFLNILYSFGLYHPFWNGNEPAWFEVQQIPSIYWVWPLAAILGFIFGRKKNIIVFFGLLAFIGIFLTKQSSMPFTGVYQWLYDFVPGFSGFREASKFFFLIVFSFSILTAYLIEHLGSMKWKYSKWIYWFSIFLICIVLTLNIKPLITKDIGSLFRERILHSDYIALQKFINNQDEYFRVAWFPRPSWWRNPTNNHPELGVMDVLSNEWSKFGPKESYALLQDGDITLAEYGVSFLRTKEALSLLSSSSVKYLVLPIDEPLWKDNVYSFYGTTQNNTYKSLTHIPYLKEVEVGEGKLKVFELITHKPHIYIGNCKDLTQEKNSRNYFDSVQLSPAHYKIYLKNINNKRCLIFNERFSNGWKLNPIYWNWFDEFKSDYSSIRSQPTSFYTNSFNLDVEKLCSIQSYNCKKRGQSYDLDLTLYYSPQSYFIAGSILSILTLVVAVFCFIWFYKKKL